MTTELRPAVFLDRDGVIIENRPDYVKSVAEVSFIPGAVEAVARLTRCGWAVVIVTNQSPIGRGWLKAETVAEINAYVREKISAAGGKVDGIYVCPHDPQAGCECRKPAPGMLQQAARDLGLDLKRSVLVGDAVSDIQAARAAGVAAVLVLTGRGAEQAASLEAAGLAQTPLAADLAAAVAIICQAV